MGCFALLKTVMIIFNSFIFTAGMSILGVGIWVKVDSGSILGFLQNLEGAPEQVKQLLNVGYLLIALGLVLMLLGFLGCYGAKRENRCMLLTFFVIILLVFIAEVVGAIVILVFKGLMQNFIQQLGKTIVSSIKKDFGKDKDITGLWNMTMTTLNCCGYNNYTDFTDSPFVSLYNVYPTQCCKTGSCYESNATAAAVSGCYKALESFFDKNSIVIIGVALGIAVLELAAMVASMTLYCCIKGKNG